MSLLQVEVSDELKTAIKEKASLYGITTSAMVRIVLVKNFIEEGNIFNADRDNNGKGMPVDTLIQKL
jgi:antitoxin component of RelBE/YafQ-DinJ toxin-antitoxin module